MKDLTNAFGTLYHPQKAFLVYQQDGANKSIYIESYDIDPQGFPINAHPLSITESAALSKALRPADKKATAFLKPAGLLPKNLLYLNTDKSAYAIWYTPRQYIKLLYRPDLGIPDGKANIPALVWRASRGGLTMFAIADDTGPNEETPLCHAPFFNIYNDGKVCMGNVNIRIPKHCGLEDFIKLWQEAFFNSYFSHMMQGHNPVKGNMVQLWKNLAGTRKKFPVKSLVTTKFKLKQLIR